jgi:hypothetical protein
VDHELGEAMKSSSWITASLGLNVLLLAVVVYAASGRAARRTGSLVSRELTNRTVRVARQPNRPAPAPAEPTTVEVPEPFQWSQIESQDYRVYVANLREIGCPEATIRDIILADVNELFFRRVKELVDPVQNRFWEFLAHHEKMEDLVKEKQEQLEALDKERDQVLEDLLGAGARHAAAEDLGRQQQRQGRLQFMDFLPEDKLELCLALEEKFNLLRQQIGSIQPPRSQKEHAAALEVLRQQQDQEIQQLLSPDELAEYKLRHSQFANVRFQLAGFEASEDEIKAVVRIREQLSATSNPGSGSNASPPPNSKAQQQALEELLGKDRLAALQRAEDGRFQEFFEYADRLALSPEVAAEAFEMRRAAEEQVSKLKQNTNLDPVARQELLKSISQETERSLADVLGETGFKLYRSRAGYWIDQFTANPGR